MTLEQIQSMTDDEIRVMVAGLMGWKNQREIEAGYWVWIAPDGNTVGQSTLPNYPADLNAIHDAVMAQDSETIAEFCNVLADVCHADAKNHPHSAIMRSVNAKARPRCEAFLAVMQPYSRKGKKDCLKKACGNQEAGLSSRRSNQQDQ